MPAETPTAPRPRRLFSAFYDSVVQRDFYENAAMRSSAGRSVTEAVLVSRMRLDLILSGRIVVTDAQLLDGGLFAATTPETLLRELAFMPDNTDSLVVRTRADTLEASVAGLLTAGERLKAFEFSVLPPGERDRFTAYLTERAAAGAPAPASIEDVTALMENGKVDPAEIKRVREHWDRWIAVVDGAGSTGMFGAERFAIGGALDRKQALLLQDRDQPYLGDDLEDLVGGGREVLDRIRHGFANDAARTALYDLIKASVSEPDAAVHLRDYVDRLFGFAFTMQHDCEDFTATWRLPTRPVRTDGRSAPARDDSLIALADAGLCEIDMPSDFLARLALAPTEELVGWAAEQRGHLASWRAEEDHGRTLKHAMTALEESLATTVSPRRLELAFEGKVPAEITGLKQFRATLKQHTPFAAVGELVYGATGLQALTTVVSLVTRPIQGMVHRALGNPSILTTDIAMPRRGAGDALRE